MDAGKTILIQYLTVSVICTVSLPYFIVVTNRSAEHSAELLFYKLSVSFAALCSFTDIFFALREFGPNPPGAAVNYGSEILYSLGSIGGSFCWFLYSESKQQSRVATSPQLIRLLAVPFAVMSAFTLTTPLHRLCFYFTGVQYVRGVLNAPFTALCSAFILCSGVRALISSFRRKYHAKAVLLRLMFLYAVFLGIAQLLQIRLGSILPFRSFAATVLFMFITLRGMCETVTVDALSQVNNRFSLNKTLDSKIMDRETFWLLLLDIDDFKQINDSFGHINGDLAIRCTASAILRAVPKEYFVARYGGDEFAVVAPLVDEARIAPLEQRIREELQQVTAENRCPFTLDITAGYAGKTQQIGSVPDIIEAADRNLYEKKRRKKLRR